MYLSVVILTCNQNAVTMRCLDSLSTELASLAGSRVVLVDNGSAQPVSKALANHNIPIKDRVEIIRLENNIGVAPGRNKGLERCMSDDFILILDNDTIVPPGAISAMLEAIKTTDQCGILAPKLVCPDGKVQSSFKNFPGIKEKIVNLCGRSPYLETAPEGILEPFYVIGACQLVRGEALRKVGLLDNDIFFGPEDADFCMRMRLAGYRVVYDPSIEIVHDWQRTSARSPLSPTSRRHIRGLLHFYRKWHRWW